MTSSDYCWGENTIKGGALRPAEIVRIKGPTTEECESYRARIKACATPEEEKVIFAEMEAKNPGYWSFMVRGWEPPSP